MLRVLAAIGGSLMHIAAAVLLPVWRHLLYIGENTIVFYGMNGLSMIADRGMLFMLVPMRYVVHLTILQIIVGLGVVAVACCVCAIITPILKRWFWWGIGVTKPRKAAPRHAQAQ
ncbi:hypothetical protein [Bifidobacterium animalis]|uniref:hypothetical protein n=1 Tax=Bifidobacterium animalis TaxID=28025 RepID=UPI001020B510|nr:hypothetical protein [Bifidobacterium animalis]